jgi:hypothetical protein
MFAAPAHLSLESMRAAHDAMSLALSEWAVRDLNRGYEAELELLGSTPPVDS